MVINPNNSYYYTPEEWSRLGMQGPLPDERNILLQRNNMKLNEVETKRGPVRNHGYCWRVTREVGNNETEEGFLCTKNVGQGEWSRSARGREPGKQVFYFVSKSTGQEIDYGSEQDALDAGINKIPWE